MTWDFDTLFLAAGNVALLAAAWGDLRRQVQANRTLSDEQHRERSVQMGRIETKVDIINGSVRQHEVRISVMESKKKKQ